MCQKKALSGNLVITTFDLRFKQPSIDDPISPSALHTLEHLGELYLRTLSPRKDEMIHFGPMGSRTGFHLIMKGDLRSQDVYEMVVKMCDFIIMHSGEIPGANEYECSNCLDHDLTGAKLCAIEYSDWLRNDPHYEYESKAVTSASIKCWLFSWKYGIIICELIATVLSGSQNSTLRRKDWKGANTYF